MAKKATSKKKNTKKIAKKDRIEAESSFLSTFRIIGLLAIGAVIAFILIYLNNIYEKKAKYCDVCDLATITIPSVDTLDDPLELHLTLAQENGINTANIDEIEVQNRLKQIKSNALFTLDIDDQSLPYATKETCDLINIIGTEFQKALQKENLPKCKLVIKSALIKKYDLNKKDPHSFGTTFDISYSEFVSSKNITNKDKIEATLGAVLSKLRKDCRIVISRNSKREVFQITTVYYKK